jgi:hypothetical protein
MVAPKREQRNGELKGNGSGGNGARVFLNRVSQVRFLPGAPTDVVLRVMLDSPGSEEALVRRSPIAVSIGTPESSRFTLGSEYGTGED